MISVEEAKGHVLANSFCLKTCLENVSNTLGSVLSEDVVAPISIPPFDQSGMDGYALSYEDYRLQRKIEIVGEVPAGVIYHGSVNAGNSVRIFTGAALPQGTDTVVMQEHIAISNDRLIFNVSTLVPGSNVHCKGSQIKRGEIALEKGTLMTPGGIGYLSALGINAVNVYSKPRVSIIITGNELQQPGTILQEGKKFESNSFTVIAALQAMRINPQEIVYVGDNEKEISEKINHAVNSADLVLITGGISVGDYDFVAASLKSAGVENVFYKIKQKPGKPLFFGRREKTLVFGLPGNPASVLCCFYEYVYPALQIMQGKKELFLPSTHLPLAKNYAKNIGLSFFLKSKMVDGKVVPLDGQESYKLNSFAIADSLIYLPLEMENPVAGEIVEVHILPLF